jgi:hypothetical protein
MDQNPNNGTNGQEPEVDGLETLSELPTETSQNPESEEFSLPDNSQDRTKEQFQKLLQSNKELKEKLQQLQNTNSESNAYGSVYDTFKTEAPAMSDDEYVDEDGNVDIKKLNADLKAAKVSALEARRLAEQAREEVEVREAHAKHPYLDPQSSNFDPAFFELVKDRVLRQKFYEGKNIPLSKIADEVSTFYRPMKSNTDNTKVAVEEYKKSRESINQNTPISSSTRVRNDGATLDDLRTRTRQGDSNAIRERLKAIGI